MNNDILKTLASQIDAIKVVLADIGKNKLSKTDSQIGEIGGKIEEITSQLKELQDNVMPLAVQNKAVSELVARKVKEVDKVIKEFSNDPRIGEYYSKVDGMLGDKVTNMLAQLENTIDAKRTEIESNLDKKLSKTSKSFSDSIKSISREINSIKSKKTVYNGDEIAKSVEGKLSLTAIKDFGKVIKALSDDVSNSVTKNVSQPLTLDVYDGGTLLKTGVTRINATGATYSNGMVNFPTVAGTTWGSITGTLTNQTDLVNAVNYKVFYTVGATNADYITDGVADEVQINQAITAANAAGGGIVFIKPGTYVIDSNITPMANVSVQGAGIEKTIIQPGATATATMTFNATAAYPATLNDFQARDFTIDCSLKTNCGGIQINGIANRTIIERVEIKNISCPGAAKWGIRFGTVVDADPDGSASFDCAVRDCIFKDNDCLTFETWLLPNVRRSVFTGNSFYNQNNNSTDVVSFYMLNKDCVFSDNVFVDWLDSAIGIKEGSNCLISNNNFNSSTSSRGARIFNCTGIQFSNNIMQVDTTGTSQLIEFRDLDAGRDGHLQWIANSSGIDVLDNVFINGYYGLSNLSNTSSNHSYSFFTIKGNVFRNTKRVPIRFGPNSNSFTVACTDFYIRDNIVESWGGAAAGTDSAITFYGAPATSTSFQNIVIENNHIADNTIDTAPGAIKLSAAQALNIQSNFLVSSGTNGAVNLSNSAAVANHNDNIGYDLTTTEFNNGNSGTTKTITASNGVYQKVTMTGNCTFTLSATAGQATKVQLKVLTGAGGFTGTFTGVTWANGVAPTLTTTASRVDFIQLYFDGTTWYGLPVFNFN